MSSRVNHEPRRCHNCGTLFKPRTIRTRGCCGSCLRELERRDDKVRAAWKKRLAAKEAA